MKICPKCGAPMEDDAGFCPKCGAKPQEPVRAYGGLCGACGERLQEGADFCPNCGAPVKPEKPLKGSAGPSRKYKLIGICAVAAVVLAAFIVLAVTVLPGLTRSDTENFVYYQQKLLVDPMLDAVTSGVNGVLGAMNTDLTVTARLDDPAAGTLLNNASAVLKIRTEKGRVVLNADVNFMGSQLITGAAYFEKGVLGFYLPQARDVLYTLDVSDYADVPDQWLSITDAGELARCVQKYLDILFSTVSDENLTVEKKAAVPYAALEGEFKGTRYTFAPSAGDIQDMLERLADTLEGDEVLARLLLARGDLGAHRTEEDARKMLADAADELRDIAREAGKAVEKADFRWVLAMEGKTVRQILITANGMSLGYEAAGDKEDRDGQHFVFFTAETSGAARALLSGEIFREGKELSGHVELDTGDGTVALRFDCQPEKRSPLGFPCGSFEVTAEGMSFGFRVEDAGDGSFDHVFTAEGISVTVNATEESTAAMPDAPTQDISGYSPEELGELMNELGYAIARDLGLGLDLGDILGGLDGDSGYGL